MTTVHADLYIALVNCGVEPDEARKLANGGHPDIIGSLVALARKLCEIQRALDKLEDWGAEKQGIERTKRFCPKPGATA